MRIGEFNKVLHQATESNGTLQTNAKAIHGGQAYEIGNFTPKAKLIGLLNELKLLPSGVDAATLVMIAGHAGMDVFTVETVEHDQLVSLFNSINSELPTILKAVEAFSPVQDEQIINIKLPEDVETFGGLTKLNNSLEALFKKFYLTNKNGLRVVGFDAGSDWYQVLIEMSDTYKWFVIAMGIALSSVKLRKEWYESEATRLTVKALKKDEKDEKALERQVIEEKIRNEVERQIENVGVPSGRHREEMLGIAVNGTKDIIAAMDAGMEFHLSLNPPAYLSENESKDFVTINYSNIPKIEQQKETKKLEDSNITPEETSPKEES